MPSALALPRPENAPFWSAQTLSPFLSVEKLIVPAINALEQAATGSDSQARDETILQKTALSEESDLKKQRTQIQPELSVRTESMVSVDGCGGGASEERGGGESLPKPQGPGVGATSTTGDERAERTVPHGATRDSSSLAGGGGEAYDLR